MPLRVIVAGAGLAGLGAAIALNRAGHEVEVFEQSGFLNEVGAAIHVAPNATRILSDWGCDFASLDPVQCNRLKVWDASAKTVYTTIITEDFQKRLNVSDGWLLTHRVDLHNTLRAAAGQEINGKKVHIALRSRVASVNAEEGFVTLENGEIHRADLIIGADGIHSRAVRSVTGEEPRTEFTGQNCFRFLVPVSKMLEDPVTASLLDRTGLDGLHAFSSEDRRLVIYPCRAGNLLNVVAIHPAEPASEVKESSYLNGGNISHLLSVYEGFAPELQAMCAKAEDLKLWSLASRTPPSIFVRGKLALVGDAAHPTLPHQGQGGAQAFEDGAALGAIFTRDVTPDQVPKLLEAYNKVRYERAVTVLFMSKTNDEKRGEMLAQLREFVPDAVLPSDMFSYTWPSYPARDAERLLAEMGSL